MPLTDDDVRKIANAVSTDLQSKQLLASEEDVDILVASAVKRACPFADEEKIHVPHGLGILKDLGSGDPAEGLRVFRENQFWARQKRDVEKRISSTVMYSVIIILVTAAGTAFWAGVKVLSQVFNGNDGG